MGHIVKSFDRDLQNIAGVLDLMSVTSREWVKKAALSIAKMDLAAARDIIADDNVISPLRRQVNAIISMIILKRQPMANDFRELTTAKEVASELPCVSECARRIARCVIEVERFGYRDVFRTVGTEEMAQTVSEQFETVMSAYQAREVSGANRVSEARQKVEIHADILRLKIEEMCDSQPALIRPAFQVVFGINELSRISWHTERLSETVHFLVYGEPRNREHLLPSVWLDGSGISQAARRKKDGSLDNV